jgi:UDP-N-acetylmuramoyl-tripeptide--D-alanyl-D-alanine ligase
MKPILKIILKYYLKYITKLVLFIHRPVIIAVAGSTNKTFVKEEIKRVLAEKGIKVRANINSFNTEIGLPLAVLNLHSGYNEYKKWWPTIFQSFSLIFQKTFPRVLVLELGASSRGDMQHLLSIVEPKIAVITDITQRYLENFSDMNDLAEEYELLARRTSRDGLVIMNYDNLRLRKIFEKIRKKKESFGLLAGSGWQAKDIERTATGEKFQIICGSDIIKKEIRFFGSHHIYAAIVGEIVKKNLHLIK